jgi:uncharacterized membrane protein
LGEEQIARPRPRIESLSDLIFGLALSIGAIALIGNPPTTIPGLYNDLLTFAFNFIILISVWMRYTRIMSVLPLENRRTIFLNILLLFCVSLEPFLFNILRSGNSATPVAAALLNASTALYGLDLGAMMLVMGVFTVALADEERKLVPREMVKRLRFEAVSWLISAGLFLVSAAPVFDSVLVGGTFLRTDLWAAALVIVWVMRGVRRRL